MSLLFDYMSMHFKVKMQYKLSFILTLISQLLIVLLELFVLQSMFEKFSLLESYNINQLYFNFSIIWLGYSLAQLLGRGFDKFSNLIIDGSLDLLLIRPRNMFIQIIGSDMYYEKLSRVLSTFVLFVYSFFKIIPNFSLLYLLTLIFIFVGSFLIIMSVFIIGASVCFYTIQGIEFINIFTDGTKHVGQYPMGLFNKTVRNIFTFVIPLTLVNYYPIMFLTGKTNNILFAFLPVISSLFIIPAILMFKHGLKKYKSSGS